jgi:hypothetical protein
MKTILRYLLLLSLPFGPLSAQNKPTNEERDARMKKATELRLAYAASAEYNPYDTKISDIRKAASDFYDQKKFPEAIAEVQKGLARSKYNIDLLIILATCYRTLGDVANADKSRELWMSLMDSVLRSGDGLGYATAFKVISVDEEYSLLGVLQLEVINQSLESHDGSQFDVMRVKSGKSDQEFVLYFNVDLPKKWLDRQLAAPAK